MTSATQVQRRRGTAAQVAAFTGAQGEIVIDTTNNRVVVQDGVTPGGWPAAKLSEVVLVGGVVGGVVNKFRNGTMDVWQRGTSGTVTTSGGYTADGWIVLPSGASVTWNQAAGPLTKNALQVIGATGVTDIQIKQRIESLIAAAFNSQTVTVQAQVYNGTGGPITPTLTVKHAGSQDNWSSPTTDVSAVSLQSCPASAWTQVAYTFTASANSYNGLEITFDFGNNFGSNTKVVQLTECDIRVTPSLSTGLCSTPPLPELRPVGMELAFCQRYYAQSYGSGAAPGTSGIAGVIASNLPSSIPNAYVYDTVVFPVMMRATPTINLYSFN